ncbi:hypothetical protein DSO57_1002626 [Entomophthora muscae]|uniref:Uncharacterized protein n=1 Tax=Entomophthora muscae TaxID=34485 RepID=A0ACC2SXW9_9FUNG|nr:hypothetical protein DSO57_1002626 [Entomophthora muscae]
MVILTILSLAEVVVPYLGAYCPLAAGMLYLSRSLPFLYWALVLQYPKWWTPPMLPWYGTTPGNVILSASLLAYCLYRLASINSQTVVEPQNPSPPAQIQTVTVSTANHNATSNCALPNIQKMNLTNVRRGLVLMGAHFKAFTNQYTDEAYKVLTVGSILTWDALDWLNLP